MKGPKIKPSRAPAWESGKIEMAASHEERRLLKFNRWKRDGETSMNRTVERIRCHTPMQVGFVPDNIGNQFRQQHWFPGEPEKSFWSGLKIKWDQRIPIKTLRCPKCGYLESYTRTRF
jgi:hypothetical protein